MQAKLAEGDVKGAIRILTSNDTLTPFNLETYVKMLAKHPTPNSHVNFDDTKIPIIVPTCESEIKKSIMTFPSGSGGGMDGLKPQHLKDMIRSDNVEHSNQLIESLCRFADICLKGNIPSFIVTVLYGASLFGFNKEGDSIRPITIGSSLRRLVAKVACVRISEKLGKHLRPKQLGFGTPGGCEAGVHAARQYIHFLHI